MKDAHILAHDYGVSTAQELLWRQEGGKLSFKIKSIAFLNGGLVPAHRPILLQKLLLNEYLGAILSSLMSKAMFFRSVKTIFGKSTQPGKQVLEDFWHVISFNEGRMISHLLIGYIEERKVSFPRWISSMKSTQVPLIYICGPADPVSGKHVAEYVSFDTLSILICSLIFL